MHGPRLSREVVKPFFDTARETDVPASGEIPTSPMPLSQTGGRIPDDKAPDCAHHGVVPPRQGSPLLGRTEELLQLRQAAEVARGGRPRAVVVEGEAGIGKSRLIAESIHDVLAADDVLLVGHGVEMLGEELPFGVVTGALRDLVRRIGMDAVRQAAGDTVPALAALVPGLAQEAPPRPDRTRTFDALATLLARLSQDRLVWLLVEDLQWVDTSSRDLLGYLIRVMKEPSRLLVTTTVRTDGALLAPAVTRLLDELVRNRTTERVILGRLSRDQSAEQVRWLLPQQDPARELLDRVVDLSDGVPFLTEELVAAGLDTDGRLPSSVGALVLNRLAGLDPSVRRVLQAASLGGAHVRHRMLAPVCGLEEATMTRALTEAVDSNVLVAGRGDGYSFRHALLREAVADSMLPGDRMLTHRRWAEQLELDAVPSDGGEALLAAAHHWSQTDDWARAFDSSLAGASRAYDVAASAEQATLLSRVLELWERVPDAAVRAGRDREEIFEETVQAMGWAGEDCRAFTLVERELRSAEMSRSDPVRLLSLRILQCDLAATADSSWKPHPPIDVPAAMRLLCDAPDSPSFVRSVNGLVWRFFSTGDSTTEKHLVARAVDVADRIGTPWDRIWTRITSLIHLSELGGHEEAANKQLQLLDWVRAEGRAVEVSVMESNCTWSLCVLGRFAEAAEMGRLARRRLGDPHLARWAWVHATENLCNALLELGEWDEAEGLLGSARELEVPGLSATLLEIEGGLIRCYRGDGEAADACLRAVSSSWAEPTSSDDECEPYLVWLSAEVALARGDVSAATELLAAFWREAKPYQSDGALWRPLLAWARLEADRAGRRSHRGRRLAEDAHERLQTIRDLGEAIRPMGPCGVAWRAHLSAELSRAEGRSDGDLWQVAVDGWSVTGQVHDEAWASVHLAECQAAVGAKQAAVELLQRAGAIGADLRAPALLDAVRAVGHRARLCLDGDLGPSRASAHPATHGLTEREVEVLRLVGVGRTNAQIASDLFISPKTASAHVSHILVKLDVGSRSQATTAGHRLGLLS
jgi:DNA-binding CsgD family transcriptional regulator